MFVVFFENESWFKTVIDLWPIGVAIVGVIVLVFAWRALEKAGIDKANEKAVNSLKELLAARDAEIEDQDAEIDRLQNDCKIKQADFDELESEYKAIAGIVLGELLTWASRYDEHRATVATLESKIRVQDLQIKAMERSQADQHTSKP